MVVCFSLINVTVPLFCSDLVDGVKTCMTRFFGSVYAAGNFTSNHVSGSAVITDSSGMNAEHRMTSVDLRHHSRNPCPICLGAITCPALTNCGHCFCATCIVHYWKFRAYPGTIRCPICRSRVSLLLTDGTLRDASNMNDIRRDINDYNRRFSGEPRPFLDYLRDVPVLIPHLCRQFFSWNGLVVMFRFRIVVCVLAALVYALSPFDLIPEACFGILGFLDDAFVFVLLLIYLSILYRRFISNTEL
ncbi:unnamed protein product [Soboliphyme baturini]|uniref:E3 ubiquitin-protein ligase RNF170 n=1 Tax=Soboliphyme baturini TaxID=241478 RepID=A0A183J2Z8_9BILA|nr:unnamed protein product [Soboliphyme baturini]